MRETEILVEQKPPQGVLVCDHAGLVINKFSSGVDEQPQQDCGYQGGRGRGDHSLSLTLTHSHSLSLTLTLTHSHSLSLTLTRSHSLTLTNTHSHSPKVKETLLKDGAVIEIGGREFIFYSNAPDSIRAAKKVPSSSFFSRADVAGRSGAARGGAKPGKGVAEPGSGRAHFEQHTAECRAARARGESTNALWLAYQTAETARDDAWWAASGALAPRRQRIGARERRRAAASRAARGSDALAPGREHVPAPPPPLDASMGSRPAASMGLRPEASMGSRPEALRAAARARAPSPESPAFADSRAVRDSTTGGSAGAR